MTPEQVLEFWFGPPAQRGRPRAEWFRKDPQFDAQINQQFGDSVVAALNGQLPGWTTTPDGCLACVLLLDQFTRNIYRNLPQAFAGDAQALALARKLVDLGWDQQLSPLERVFAYLPFEHAESLAEQDRAVALFEALAAAQPTLADYLVYAQRHREVIARFGRFPHRNAILGRTSSLDEQIYLQQPGAGF
ncbi:DUF924 family protein [Parachitinimonas caeni]|uniref:DUF924 domain-containing protein n=1 Tax=Parachitinimonas caeni TaxID=3031301 RepID=A0ABT7DR12_9NEIS|nr:DUF924 family protein [Parachitinimonas caeni]MDK2122510.1 DUF924 domain-containing protein [Parachitinimonas caeni]